MTTEYQRGMFMGAVIALGIIIVTGLFSGCAINAYQDGRDAYEKFNIEKKRIIVSPYAWEFMEGYTDRKMEHARQMKLQKKQKEFFPNYKPDESGNVFIYEEESD